LGFFIGLGFTTKKRFPWCKWEFGVEICHNASSNGIEIRRTWTFLKKKGLGDLWHV
jgi:hypothetical protein